MLGRLNRQAQGSILVKAETGWTGGFAREVRLDIAAADRIFGHVVRHRTPEAFGGRARRRTSAGYHDRGYGF